MARKPAAPRTRISANLRLSVYLAARDQAAATGLILDAFITNAITEAASWKATDRNAIFAAIIGRERDEDPTHQSISWSTTIQAQVDAARKADWIECGQVYPRSRWIDLAVDAYLSGGLRAPRAVFVPTFDAATRRKIVKDHEAYGIDLDHSGLVPSKPVRGALTMRINPTVVAHARRIAAAKGMDLRDYFESTIIAADGGPTAADQTAAAERFMEQHAAKAEAEPAEETKPKGSRTSKGKGKGKKKDGADA